MAIKINGWDGNAFGIGSQVGNDNNFFTTWHTLTFSGSYAAGGDTMDFTTVAMPSTIVVSAEIDPQGSGSATINATNGNYIYLKGTTLKNNKLKIYVGAGTEYPTGAYSTDVTGDTVVVKLTWRKLT